jgi:hypothetical protein
LPIFAQLQNIEYGLGIMYNFQSNGIGIDGRGEIPVTKKISITPRIAYFPGFNTIHEAYAGLDGDYHFLILKSYKFYGIIGAYYNGWLNYDKFDESIAKKNNFTFETGVGAEFTKKCISPFFETRISSKWKEAFFIFGIKFCRSNCKGTYRTIKCPDF